MHLVFERSKGRFRSSCNILALAWTPYYNEKQFRQALFDYHQRQLFTLNQQGRVGRDEHNINNDNDNGANQTAMAISNSRLAELRQRYNYLKSSQQNDIVLDTDNVWTHMEQQYDANFGKMCDFGWLVIGNVGKIIGITLTSLVPPPIEGHAKVSKNKNNSGDLIRFDDEKQNQEQAEEERSLNLGTCNSSSSSNYESWRPDKRGVRQNYNLRGHLEEIILVRWNELYQKLATVDSKGNVLIWCKINDKFTIQTPFYNRTKSVADFKWSNDGKTALICYTDSFILVGSSSGQRSWHSMLNLNDYHITCASWTPNDEQLLLGVSNGNIVVIDLPNNELTELVVDRTNIRAICWSSGEISLKNVDDNNKAPSYPTSFDQDSRRNSYGKNNTVVNQRRLSRDCSVFSRNRFCSQGLNQGQQQQQQYLPLKANVSGHQPAQESRALDVLAIDFANNTIKLYENGLSDPKPTTIHVNQESYIMQWSSDGKILAVAGFNIHTTAPTVGYLRCRYLNAIKFYNQQGRLIYEHVMKYTRYPITAFTWAHNDRRLFVATGQRLHCAKVFLGVPKLSLLAISNFQRFTKLPDKSDILESVIGNHFNPSILDWQSHNCPIDLQIRREAIKSIGAQDDAIKTIARNNCLVHQYRLPSKLLTKIDELFATTIKQPYDENWSLNDVVWRVPSSNQRYYCTLICYASEREVNMNDHQYRTGSTDGLSDDHVHDQNKIFVLYVEFQGSLIPILRARRIGYLKPEFVIFDPDDGHSTQQKQQKVSDISQQPNIVSASGKYYNLEDRDSMDRQNQRRQAEMASGRSHHQEPLPLLPSNPHLMMLMMGCPPSSDYYHHYNGQQRQQSSGIDINASQAQLPQTPQKRTIKARRIRKETGLSTSLSETSELIRIKSNIWGTKFKIINVANRMIRHRSIIGSVSYKASILHLQPRQIHLNLKDMSNFCCLCSKHHHRPSMGSKINTVSGSSKSSTNLTLLDLPNTFSSNISESSRKSSKRSNEQDKIVLDVGASLRIAPVNDRLSRNFQNLRRQHSDMLSDQTRRHRQHRHGFSLSEIKPQSQPMSRSFAPSSGHVVNQVDLSEPSTSSCQKDDILTLSLGQGDQVKVEMSSIRALDDLVGDLSVSSVGERQEDANTSDEAATVHQDEFLSMNKTLKSIQTITKMIVDLSSRAGNDVPPLDSDDTAEKDLASPSKIVKRYEGNFDGGASTSTSNDYIPPQAPVHRPRRTAASRQHLHNKDYTAGGVPIGTQSATSTPLRSLRADRPSRSREKRSIIDQHSAPNPPLPPPPLPVPFGRRITSTAKRFIDGSLRSLSLSSTGYSTATLDAEPEENEPLVSKPSGRWLMNGDLTAIGGRRLGLQSQPCSPMRSSSPASTRAFKNQADAFLSSASSFRSQLMSRLRSAGDPPNETVVPSNTRHKREYRHKSSSRANSRTVRTPTDFGCSAACSESEGFDESDFSESDTEPESGSGSESEQDEILAPIEVKSRDGSRKAGAGGISASVRDLRELKATASSRQDKGQQKLNAGQSGRRVRTRQRTKRKSICPNANCCCAKEFKLNNRPPVWNETSQVYQLDFGGRVTQESAKNLQIDYEGNLALQFGRINWCTYTLDYKYPFNAVQAMAIALASLTQRLK